MTGLAIILTILVLVMDSLVVMIGLATTAVSLGKLTVALFLPTSTDKDLAITKLIVPSLARWVPASTVVKKGEQLLVFLHNALLMCFENSHSKAECPKPRVFKGTCRICEKEGHPAAECPERPPDVCKNCLAQGHKTIECTDNRKFDLNFVADMLPHEGWAAMKKASDERDLDDFREVLVIRTYPCKI